MSPYFDVKDKLEQFVSSSASGPFKGAILQSYQYILLSYLWDSNPLVSMIYCFMSVFVLNGKEIQMYSAHLTYKDQYINQLHLTFKLLY